MLRTFWNNAVDPFRELTPLHEWMDQSLEHVFKGVSPQTLAAQTFAPPAEVLEDGEHLTLKVDVPGVSDKDFDITLNNNVLTVRGQRQFGNGYKQENLAWTERPYGTFIRTFTLPNTIDLNSIDATYVNGVLQIVFAKCEDAKPKQIPVKAAQKELAASPSA